MFEYAISFYNEYIFLFYFLVTIAVILEWPIVILTLTLLSPKLGISFPILLFFALIWDFWWDILHFFVWKFFKKYFLEKQKFKKLEDLNKKINSFPLLDRLIIIKYTPPITSIWLIYLWVSGTKIWDFVKRDFPLCLFSSLLVLFIWYNFWEYFKNSNNLTYFFLAVWFAIFVVIFSSKIIWNFIIKKIYNKNKQNDS